MSERDGVPAFPVAGFQTADGSEIFAPTYGMSLRDWYAGMALQGLLGLESSWVAAAKEMKEGGDNHGKFFANASYEIADAMIKARGGK